MCMICSSDEPARYIDFYIIGSEGLRVCHSCEMEIVEFIRNLRHDKLDKKFQDAKKLKMENSK